MVEPDPRPHATVWQLPSEGAIYGSTVRKGKSSAYAALLIADLDAAVDAAVSAASAGGEQQ